jgi:hypothetical protein
MYDLGLAAYGAIDRSFWAFWLLKNWSSGLFFEILCCCFGILVVWSTTDYKLIYIVK